MRKEKMNLSLVRDDMIFYIENYKEPTKSKTKQNKKFPEQVSIVRLQDTR